MGIQDLNTKMNWSTRRKSSKPSLTNLTKLLLKCRVINNTAKYCRNVVSTPLSLLLYVFLIQLALSPNVFLLFKANTKCNLTNPPTLGPLDICVAFTIYKFPPWVPTNVNTNVQLIRWNSQVQVRYILHFLKFLEIFSSFSTMSFLFFLSCTHLSLLIYS